MARKKAVSRSTKSRYVRKKRIIFGYPLIIFLLLAVGVFLVTATFPSLAADIHVRAKVSAPFVTDPASIDSPTEGSHFSSIPIEVSGTCTTNAAYVEIFRNGQMSGTAVCDIDQKYNLAIDLFPGQNKLEAHVFNMTDDEGPVSLPVNVFYDVPQLPPTTSTGKPGSKPTTSRPSAPSLVVSTEFVYKGYRLNDLVTWPISISGGRAPYTINVDWGDGSYSSYSRSGQGAFEITHQYTRLPSSGKTFTIKVSSTDAGGDRAYIQFFVVIVSKLIPPPAANIFSKSPPSISGHSWLWFAWPAYLLLFIMVLSYWLGEREELIMLKKRGQLKRRR
jgi:hypothetical protein